MTSDESIRVTVRVPLSPRDAFALFTEDIDSWWQRKSTDVLGPTLGGTLRFVDRTLRQSFETGEERIVAHVGAWEVGERLHLELIDREDGDATRVEVSFAQAGDDTEVVLEHHGCQRLAPQHPSRRGLRGLRGLRGRAFADMLALRWADRLARLQRASR